MSGITFFRSEDLERTKEFYLSDVGMDMWVDQGGCCILRHGNLLLGFCEGEELEDAGVITFFYDTKEEVDRIYDRFEDIAEEEPKDNEEYGIYNFFAKDPEGRTIEFQTFLHELPPYLEGDELLRSRRSVRRFEDKKVRDELLMDIVETCRFSPTSMNSQSFYFITIKERATLETLASERGRSSAPIKEAPMAVAICTDPEVTKRPVQDGCIAAYHFILTAWLHGLGTCWIADMDRESVKESLGIPKDHYVATVTPLGYPASVPKTPERKPAEDFLLKEIG